MYVKIPTKEGEENINLTMEYLQEDEDPTQFLRRRRKDNKITRSAITSFGYISVNPWSHTFRSVVLALQTKNHPFRQVLWGLETPLGISLSIPI